MSFMNNNYQKVNTFSRKIQMSQTFTYSLILGQLIIFLAAIQGNYLSLSSKIVMIFLMILSFVVLLITCYKCSSIDPVDAVMLEYRNGDHRKVVNEQNSYLYCDACSSYVKRTSKHCKLCDRCVDHFDHHCNWINNCIGLDNYYWFFVMIIAAFTYMLSYCLSVGLLYHELNWSNFKAAMIVAWVMFGVTLPFALLLLILIIFHIHLIRLGVTTFEYIMQGRKVQQIDMQQSELQRKQEMNKTEQSIVVKDNIRKKVQEGKGTVLPEIIFQRSQESSQSQIHKGQNNKQSTKHANPSTEALKNREEQTSNEKQVRQYFKKHNSMKFLLGQSFFVTNRTQMSYFTTKNSRERQGSQYQKPFRSLHYQQKDPTHK